MSLYKFYGAILGFGLAAMTGAQAQTSGPQLLPGTNGTTNFSVGGWNVQLSSCALKVQGVAQTNCSAEQVTGTIAGGNLTLLFQGAGGGNLLSSVVCGATCTTGLSDLALSETITAPSGQMISAVVLNLAGTTTSASDNLAVSVGETIVTPSGNGNISTNLANNPTAKTQTLAAPANVISINKDMRANGSGGFGSNGDSISLNSVTQTYALVTTSVPEPATLSILGFGLAALIGTRRRRAPAAV